MSFSKVKAKFKTVKSTAAAVTVAAAAVVPVATAIAIDVDAAAPIDVDAAAATAANDVVAAAAIDVVAAAAIDVVAAAAIDVVAGAAIVDMVATAFEAEEIISDLADAAEAVKDAAPAPFVAEVIEVAACGIGAASARWPNAMNASACTITILVSKHFLSFSATRRRVLLLLQYNSLMPRHQ
ncbi:hypothetical protein HDU84_001879 [Entophlyctis sp. JEL0112]|nr:hypothetical protein HDU84_001879 [Entophlyctis sp. JEL0112]